MPLLHRQTEKFSFSTSCIAIDCSNFCAIESSTDLVIYRPKTIQIFPRLMLHDYFGIL